MTALWLTAWLACRSDFGIGQGASGVGNPGSTKQALSRGGDATYTVATVFTDQLEIARCAEDPDTIALDRLVDLLDDEPVDVPGGAWCLIRATWTAPLHVEGAAEEGEPNKGTFVFDLEVSSATIVVQPPYLFDGDDLILELAYPTWLEREGLPLEDGTFTEVQAGDALHDELVEAIEQGSGLYVDADGDGAISVDERAGLLGAGPLHDPTPSDDE